MSSQLSKTVDSLISSVDAMSVIQALGARNIRQQPSGWIIHSCLIDEYDPHHSNGDNNPSAAIDSKTKRYSCFSYGVIPLKKLLGMAFGTETNIYNFLLGHETGAAEPFGDQLLERMSQKHVRKHVPLDKSILDVYSPECEYMTKTRGISEAVAREHSIRYDKDTNSVVIPLFDGKDLLGIQRRNLTPGKPKYTNSQSFDKESYLYYTNGSQEADEVVIVESVMSALKVKDAGFPSVATLGSIVFDEQLPKLLRHKRIVIWFDDDLSGVKGAKNFVRKAGALSDIKVVVSSHRNKDPADMTIDEIKENIGNAMPVMVARPFLEKAYELLRTT